MLICIVVTLFASVKRTFVLIFAYRSMNHKMIEKLDDISFHIRYHKISNQLVKIIPWKIYSKWIQYWIDCFIICNNFCANVKYSALKICWQMAIPENRPILHCVLSKSIQNCKNKCAFFPAEFCFLFISWNENLWVNNVAIKMPT